MTNDAASALSPLACPRCGAAGEGYAGCVDCRRSGVPVNLVPPRADLSGLDPGGFGGGPWGWPASTPVPAVVGRRTSLGEGNTPCVAVVPGSLWVKDESRNPTGTHKDRAMTVGLAAAAALGVSTVVAASTGNAGAAAAAYAARAGLACVVFTQASIPPVVSAQITAYGAKLLPCENGEIRNRLMAEAVADRGWYPLTNYVLPCAGDNPYANEGYKSIAYELVRDLGSDVDVIVVPTSGADVLAGIEHGYREMVVAGLVDRVPRLVAAETATGASFTAALRSADRSAQERTIVPLHPSPAFSIGSAMPTWQGLNALWRTGGEAIEVDVEDYLKEHRRLPARTGVFLEPSSAVAVVAARRLLRRDPMLRVVALGTGSGMKTVLTEAARERPVASTDMADLDAVLAAT